MVLDQSIYYLIYGFCYVWVMLYIIKQLDCTVFPCEYR